MHASRPVSPNSPTSLGAPPLSAPPQPRTRRQSEPPRGPRPSSPGVTPQQVPVTYNHRVSGSTGSLFAPHGVENTVMPGAGAALRASNDSFSSQSCAELDWSSGSSSASLSVGRSESSAHLPDLNALCVGNASASRAESPAPRPANPLARDGVRLRPDTATPSTQRVLDNARAVQGRPDQWVTQQEAQLIALDMPAGAQRLLESHGATYLQAARAGEQIRGALERGGQRAPSGAEPMTVADLQQALPSVGPRAISGGIPEAVIDQALRGIEDRFQALRSGGEDAEADAMERMRTDFHRCTYTLNGHLVSPPLGSSEKHTAALWEAFREKLEQLPAPIRHFICSTAYQRPAVDVGQELGLGRLDGAGGGILHPDGVVILSERGNKETTSFDIHTDASIPQVVVGYTRNIHQIAQSVSFEQQEEVMRQASAGSHYQMALTVTLRPPLGAEGDHNIAVEGRHAVEITYPTRGARSLSAIVDALPPGVGEIEDMQQSVLTALQRYARYCRTQANEFRESVVSAGPDEVARHQRSLHHDAIVDLAAHLGQAPVATAQQLLAVLNTLSGRQLNELAYVQDLMEAGFEPTPESFTQLVNAVSDISGYTLSNQLREVAMGIVDTEHAHAAGEAVEAGIDALPAALIVEDAHPAIGQTLQQLGLPVRQADMGIWEGDVSAITPLPPLAAQLGQTASRDTVGELQDLAMMFHQVAAAGPDALARHLLGSDAGAASRLRTVLDTVSNAYRVGIATPLPPALAQMALAEVDGYLQRNLGNASVVGSVQEALFIGPDATALLLPAERAWDQARQAEAHLAWSATHADGRVRRGLSSSVRTALGTIRVETAGQREHALLHQALPALGRVRDTSGTAPGMARPSPLTPAQQQVMAEVCIGCTNQIIAAIDERAAASAGGQGASAALAPAVGGDGHSSPGGAPPPKMRGGSQQSADRAGAAAQPWRPSGWRRDDSDEDGAAGVLRSIDQSAVLPESDEESGYGSVPPSPAAGQGRTSEALHPASRQQAERLSLDPQILRKALLALSRPASDLVRPEQLKVTAQYLQFVAEDPQPGKPGVLLDPEVLGGLVRQAVAEAMEPPASGADNAAPFARILAQALHVTCRGTEPARIAAALTGGGGYRSALGELARGRGMQLLAPLVRLMYGELALGVNVGDAPVPNDKNVLQPLSQVLKIQPVCGSYPPAALPIPTARVASVREDVEELAARVPLLQARQGDIANAMEASEQQRAVKAAAVEEKARQTRRQVEVSLLSLSATNQRYVDARERRAAEHAEMMFQSRMESASVRAAQRRHEAQVEIAATQSFNFQRLEEANRQGALRAAHTALQRQLAVQPRAPVQQHLSQGPGIGTQGTQSIAAPSSGPRVQGLGTSNSSALLTAEEVKAYALQLEGANPAPNALPMTENGAMAMLNIGSTQAPPSAPSTGSADHQRSLPPERVGNGPTFDFTKPQQVVLEGKLSTLYAGQALNQAPPLRAMPAPSKSVRPVTFARPRVESFPVEVTGQSTSNRLTTAPVLRQHDGTMMINRGDRMLVINESRPYALEGPNGDTTFFNTRRDGLPSSEKLSLTDG